jgi:hypothetical protein
MNQVRSASIVVGVALLLASAGQAQVELKSGTVHLPELATPEARAAAVRTLTEETLRDAAADRHVLVRFDGPVSLEQRDALARAGLTLQTYVGGFAYVAKLSDDGVDANAIANAAPLRGAARMEGSWKIHPLAAAEEYPEYALINTTNAADPIVAISVLFHPDAPMGEPARDVIRRHGGVIQRELLSLPVIVAHVPRSAIAAIAAEPAVQWVEPPLPQLSPVALRNDSNRERTGADIVHAAPYNLTGAGVVAFVFDAGTVMASHEAFFPGRVTVIDNDGVSFHATHVAGTIGGNGASATGQLRKGMAPGVTLLSAGFQWTSGGQFLYSDPGDLEADYAEAINDHGAHISNNSIGSNTETNGFPCSIQGDYGITDALIDNIVRGGVSGGEPFRVVWANGNERQGSRCDIEGFGDYYSVAPPAGAKNHLTVGALNSNDDSMTSFSSWGPTDDGRMKPDISAPGCQSNGDGGVTSATTGGTTSYASLCGTSMASPTVCGLAALVLEDYRANFPGAPDPRNSTLRALFAHTAVDLFNPGPDYKSGYGSVRVQDAIDLLRTGRLQEASIDQGGIFTTAVTALPGQPLKVTIAWDDPPATPLALNALVNDLDLRLIDPNGQVHEAWVLDPAAPSADATRGANRRDNIEQVYVADPIPGNWTVEVIGFNVPQGPQPFSIIGAGQTTALLVSFPQPLPEFIPAGVPTNLDVRFTVLNQEVEPDSAQFHFRPAGGSFVTVPLTDLGDNFYRATIPAPPCGGPIEYYFSVTGTVSGQVNVPVGAPDAFFSAAVGEVATRFEDSFETDNGWTVLNFQSGSRTFRGEWTRAVPVLSTGAPPADADPEGTGLCFITGASPNHDVDNGTTILVSPLIDVSGGDALVSYSRWFYNSNPTDAPEVFRVEYSTSGENWQPFETVGPTGDDVTGGWRRVTLPAPPANQIRFRFIVSDLGVDSTIEAGLDAFRVRVVSCDEEAGCDTDWNYDLLVNSADISAFLTAWLTSLEQGTMEADFNGDAAVNSSDISAFLSEWLLELAEGC